MTLKVKQNGQWKDLTKKEWHLATDEDFTGTPNASDFRYIGNQENIILPTHVNGVRIMSYRRLFFSSTNNEEKSLISNNQNITDMGYMFQDCFSLTSLDLSYFDTSNVTSMGYMFQGCTSLTSLDLSSFDTSNVTSIYGMFRRCTSLQTVYVKDQASKKKFERLATDTPPQIQFIVKT